MRFLAFVLSSLGLLTFSASAPAQDPTPVILEDSAQGRAEEPIPTLVEECTAPCAGYDISSRLQNDWIFAANPAFLKSDQLQPTVEVDLFFAPTDYLQFVTTIITEPVVLPEPGESAIFNGIGTFVSELYAAAEAGPAAARVGKFDTVFSLAGEINPGIRAMDLASEVDADERLGVETALVFEGLGMNHALAATAFTFDRTVLSESLFTNRGRTSLSDGGAGNTDGPSSFLITLDGCRGSATPNCYWDGEFGYRLGLRYQKAGQPPPVEEEEEQPLLGDEVSYLAAATRNFEFDRMTLRLLGEATYLRHFDSGPDDALFLTGSAALEVERLTYLATYTQQLNLVAEGPNTREQWADFEIIYSSEEDRPFAGANWELASAYTFARNSDDEEAHIFSVRARFDFSGTVEFGR